MSSRLFWAALGAAAGVAAYRKGSQSLGQAKDAGALGTAQALAVGTGKLANQAARGLGKLIQLTDERSGKLLHGQALETHGAVPPVPIPPNWQPVGDFGTVISTPRVAPGDQPGGQVKP